MSILKHSPNDESDIQKVLDAVRRIVRALRVSSRRAEKNLGLSGAQLFVLQKIGEGPGLSLNELAEKTLTHQSSVSVVVSRLVEKGFIERKVSKDDGRRMTLGLTATGKRCIRKSPEAVQRKLIAALELLPAAERRKLADLFTLVVSNAGLSHETPALLFEEESTRPRTPRKKR